MPLAACIRIASTQHGVLSTGQALDAGLSRSAIGRLVQKGAWTRVRPSVFALWVPASREELWPQRLTAAALWLGATGAVSHRAASMVWELDGIDAAPIELSTTGRRRVAEAGLLIHRVRSLRADEVLVRGGIRVTSVPRTLIDLCAVADPRVVELALESTLRRRLATISQIRAALAQTGPRPWCRRVLSPLLDGPQTPTESALEVIVWRLLREGGLPPPERQHEVRLRTGRLVARVDFAYPEALIAIEADGHEFHSSRRDWQRDRTRQNALTRLGWRVYRITWEDATRRPQAVVADVAALLG